MIEDRDMKRASGVSLSKWRRFVRVGLLGAVCVVGWLSVGCTSQVRMVSGSGGGVQLGPVDIELRSGGRRLPCFVNGGQIYVVGQRGLPYSVWIKNRTPQRLEVLVSVDGRDVITGRRQTMRNRGYILLPYRFVNITGYRTSMRTVAAFRFSAIHRSYSSRMGSSWFKVGSIRVSVFDERGRQVYRPRGPMLQGQGRAWKRPKILSRRYSPMPRGGVVITRRHTTPTKRRYDTRRRQKSIGPMNDSASPPSPSARPHSHMQVRRAPRRAVPLMKPNGSRFGGSTSGARLRPRDHGFRYPTPREGLGTAFGERRYAPAQYTTFYRSSSRPSFQAVLLYNNCAGYRAMNLCTPWCPCYRPEPLAMSSYQGGFAPAP